MSEMSSRGQCQPTYLHSYENANIWLRQRLLQEEQLIDPDTGDQFLLGDLWTLRAVPSTQSWSQDIRTCVSAIWHQIHKSTSHNGSTYVNYATHRRRGAVRFQTAFIHQHKQQRSSLSATPVCLSPISCDDITSISACDSWTGTPPERCCLVNGRKVQVNVHTLTHALARGYIPRAGWASPGKPPDLVQTADWSFNPQFFWVKVE